MYAYLRRDPLRAIRLLFLFTLLAGSTSALVQVGTSGAARQVAQLSTIMLGGLVALRVVEFRTGRLMPFVVDLVDIAVLGALLLQVGELDAVLGPVYGLLLFRAATGNALRLLTMVTGYIGVTFACANALGAPLPPGMYEGMVVSTVLVYGMRTLLLRLRAEQEKQSRMLSDVLSSLPLPVLVVDSEGEVLLTNTAATTLTGPLDDLRVCTADGSPADLRRLAQGQQELVLNSHTQVIVETVPTEHGTIVAMLDVTAQRDYETRLEYAAFHDALTGLPNRAQLWRDLAAQDRSYAALLLDLDGFKAVNDTRGHLAGDELLCRVSEQLRHVCGTDATVARLGGDEFAVLLPGAGDGEASAAIEAIRSIFKSEVLLTIGPVRVGASIGFAVGTPSQSADDVLAAADAAMYAEKHLHHEALTP